MPAVWFVAGVGACIVAEIAILLWVARFTAFKGGWTFK